MSLTACLEALETLRTFAGDVRGTATCLELRLGTLQAAAALVIGVLPTLTAGGRGRTLQRGDVTCDICDDKSLAALTVNFPAAMRRLQRHA